MSTSSGKKPAQRHKNSFAFVPSKHSAKAMAIAAIEVTGCCQKCIDVIEYKQRFGKYKSLTQPAICLKCTLKKVTHAYHVICQLCAGIDGVCAKCRTPCELAPTKTLQEQIQLKQQKQAVLASMSERQRRSYSRKLDNGDRDGAAKLLGKVADKDEYSDYSDE